MSDQLTTTTTIDAIDESTLDPKVVEYFTRKFEPVVRKKDELLGDVASMKALRKELETLGGLDAVKALKQQADDAQQAAEAARLEKLSKEGKLAEVEEHYKKLLQDKDGKLSAFQQKLLSREVEAQLAAAIGDDGSPVLLLPHLRSRVEASFDEDGEIVLTVKGKAGQTLNGEGGQLTLKDLVAEFKADAAFAGAFKAPQVNGGGNRGSKAAAGADNPFATATLNVTKQMELIRNSPEVAKALAKAAGITPDW